jgi:hypothetical protein
MNIRRLLGIKTQEERFAALPESMSDDERVVICETIHGFLDDTIGDHDWDWLMTAPKKSKEAERISEFSSGIDFIFPSQERHRFTSESGEAALHGLLKIVEDDSHTFEDVCCYIATMNKNAEQDVTPNA